MTCTDNVSRATSARPKRKKVALAIVVARNRKAARSRAKMKVARLKHKSTQE